MKKQSAKNFFSNDEQFNKLKIGTKFGFVRRVKFKDIKKYANLVQDKNPLHLKEKTSGNIKKKTIISHGMFVGSMTSALLGTHCPIKNNILLSLSLNFKKPVLLNYKIRIQGKIVAKSEALRILTVKINIYYKHILLIDGEAKLKVLQ
jgi:acyl dehydratase|tara:strand:+ start:647 stop:1090 length:444 start_codon:yes stop_codon:yes gene_type:complete